MMIVYKLTDANRQTRNGFTYHIGAPAFPVQLTSGTRLCSGDVLHAYESPEQAAFMAPAHCQINQRTLWEAETPAIVVRDGTKVGVKELTLLRHVPLPALTTEQRIQVAIACTWLETPNNDPWRTWALRWLRGIDRAASAAEAAAYAASYAASYAADAAAFAADAAAFAAAFAAAYAKGDTNTTIITILRETPAETADRLDKP